MKHFTPYQWTVGILGIAAYCGWIARLWRDALYPKIEITQFQRGIRFTAAVVFSIALLAAIPYWLGLWG